MGTVVEAFRHVGLVACVRERLKSLVRIPASWSVLALITTPGMPSGPAPFLGFTALKFFLTSCSWRERGRVMEPGGGRDCRCVMVVSNHERSCLVPLPVCCCCCCCLRMWEWGGLCSWLGRGLMWRGLDAPPHLAQVVAGPRENKQQKRENEALVMLFNQYRGQHFHPSWP